MKNPKALAVIVAGLFGSVIFDSFLTSMSMVIDGAFAALVAYGVWMLVSAKTAED